MSTLPTPSPIGRTSYANGYGASVIAECRYDDDPGEPLFELAVLHDGALCYKTPITGDVLRYRPAREIRDVLLDIADLPAQDLCAHVRSYD